MSWSRVLLKSLAAHRKLALARNAAVRIAELELRARELLQAFKRPGEVNVFAVMLPEPLPDRETERLLSELEHLGLTASALFVNRLIFPKDAANCSRCRSAAEWQSSVLVNLTTRHSTKEIFAIRNFMNEIAGATGLRAMPARSPGRTSLNHVIQIEVCIGSPCMIQFVLSIGSPSRGRTTTLSPYDGS